jgi:hypothetical protein
MEWKEIKLKDYSIKYYYNHYELIRHLDERLFNLYPNELMFAHYSRNNVVKFFHDYIVYGSKEAYKLNKFEDKSLN